MAQFENPWGTTPPPASGKEPLRRKEQKIFPGPAVPLQVNGRLVFLAVIGLFFLWALSGIYQVGPEEQGLVLRFGKYVKTTEPGLQYHLPYPIETVFKPNVMRENKLMMDRGDGDRGENLMLTGDENLVNMNYVVVYRVKNAKDFLFNIRNVEETISVAAESAMREIVGQTKIDLLLNEGREDVQSEARKILQSLLDEYKAGIQVTAIQLQRVDAPSQVIEAFNDVQRAKADKERARNEAEAYVNDIIPRARGEAQKILQDAEAYRAEQIVLAEGETARFLSVLRAYESAPDISRKKIYLETLEEVFGKNNKMLMDVKNGQMYIPMPALSTGGK